MRQDWTVPYNVWNARAMAKPLPVARFTQAMNELSPRPALEPLEIVLSYGRTLVAKA